MIFQVKNEDGAILPVMTGAADSPAEPNRLVFDEDIIMLKQRMKVARAALVLAALLCTTAACTANGYVPAPAVAPGQAMPMDVPQGGG